MSDIDKTERTSRGLRESMFSVLDDVISGKISPAQANAAARAADQVIKVINVELQLRRHAKDFPNDDAITTKALPLA